MTTDKDARAMPAADLTPEERLSEVTRILGEGARRLLEQRRQRQDQPPDQTPASAEANSRS